MHRIILSIVLALGLATAAWAGYNIKQNPDGSTSLVNERDSREILHLSRDGDITKKASDSTESADLDDIHLTVRLTDIGATTAHYVAVPVTGTVKRVQVTTQAQPGATTKLYLWNGNRFFTDGVVTFATSVIAGTLVEQFPTGNHNVTPGSILRIVSDGGAANTVEAVATITISR